MPEEKAFTGHQNPDGSWELYDRETGEHQGTYWGETTVGEDGIIHLGNGVMIYDFEDGDSWGGGEDQDGDPNSEAGSSGSGSSGGGAPGSADDGTGAPAPGGWWIEDYPEGNPDALPGDDQPPEDGSDFEIDGDDEPWEPWEPWGDEGDEDGLGEEDGGFDVGGGPVDDDGPSGGGDDGDGVLDQAQEVKDAAQTATSQLADLALAAWNVSLQQLGMVPEAGNGPGLDAGQDERVEAGDPVDLASGAWKAAQVDAHLTGIGPELAVTRSYSNQWYGTGSFGPGWDTWFDASVRALPSGAAHVRLGNGTSVFFGPEPAHAPQRGVRHRLTRLGASPQLRTPDDDVLTFDRDGRLVTWLDVNGVGVTVARDGAGRPTRIAHTDGRALVLDTDAEGRVTSCTDPLGREWRYAYDADGRLERVIEPCPTDSSIVRWRFAYAPVTDPRLRAALTQVRDAQDVVQLINRYGSSGDGLNRVVEQNVADGRWTFDYRVVARPRRTPSGRHRVARSARVTGPDGTVLDLDTNAWGLPVTRRQTAPGEDPAETRYTYDTSLRLDQVTLPRGNRVTVSWSTDAHGRHQVASQSRQPQGTGAALTSSFAHDSDGRLTGVTTAGGAHASYRRDSRGRVTAVTVTAATTLNDPTDAVTRYTYDRFGRVTRMTAPDGVATEFSYAEAAPWLCTEVRTAGTVVSTYRWDLAGRLIEASDADGATISYEYDPGDRPTLVAAPEGVRVRQHYDAGRMTMREELLRDTESPDRWICSRFSYDRHGRCSQVERDLSPATTQRWQLSWDEMGRPARVDTPDGGAMTWRWNADGFPLEEVVDAGRPTARVEQWRWDGNGLLTETTTTLGRVTRFTHDDYDRPVRVDLPDGSVRRLTWDRDDRPTRIELADADGVVRSDERTTYDPLGLPLEVARRIIHADGSGTDLARARMSYDLCGRLTALTDALGRGTRWAWDAHGQLTTHVDPIGTRTQFERTAAGHLTGLGVQLPGRAAEAAQTWQVGHDAFGRVTGVVDPLGNAEHYRYDTLDRLVEVRRAEDVVEKLRHDDLGRLVERRWTDGASTAAVTYSWDPGGRLQRLVDPDGSVTTLDWDPRGNLRRVEADDGIVLLRIDLDEADRPTRIADASGTPIDLEWDVADRLTRRTYQDVTETFGYDVLGQLVSADNGRHRVTRSIDSLGRVESEATDGELVRWEYGPDLFVRRIDYPSGAWARFDRDALGQPTSMTTSADGSTVATELTWRAPGQLSGVAHANGLVTHHAYDRAARLIRTTTADAAGSIREQVTTLRGPSGLVLVRHRAGHRLEAFRHDFLGQVIERRSTPADRSIDVSAWLDGGTGTQDGLTALAESLDPGGAAALRQRWDLSLGGDRTRERAGGRQGASYRLDGRHRIVEVDGRPLAWDANGRLLDDGHRSYHHDALGRLLEVRSAQGAVELRISRDGFGRPRLITKGDASQVFRHAGAVLIEQQHDGAALSLFGATAADELLIVHDSRSWTHLHADETWSTLSATDASGEMLWRASWDPHGRGAALTPDFTGDVTLPELARFQGRPRLDDDLIDLRSRTLHTGLGRFIQPDPLHPFGDPNPYRFAGNNSLVGTDPDGELLWFAPVLAGVIIGSAFSGWANRNKSGADFWVAVGAGALGGAIAGSGLGTPGAVIGGALSGAIVGGYEGSKSGVEAAVVGGTLGAVAGGLAGAAGDVVGRQVAAAVTRQVLSSATSGVLRNTAISALGPTGRTTVATWAGTAGGAIAGGGAGGFTGGVVYGTGQVLANGGDFRDAVTTGAMGGLVGARDGALYGFVGAMGSRAAMWGGWYWKTKSFSRVLGEEGEWWMANQTLNRVNNKVPGVGEPDSWGVPRLPGVAPVHADAKNTQNLPNMSGTNHQIQRYLDALPNPYHETTNPTGNSLWIYHRPGVSMPGPRHSLAPALESGLLRLKPLEQSVMLPPWTMPSVCGS